MTLGFSDGERLWWGVRYSSEGRSGTLYVSADASAVRALHPDNPRLEKYTDEDRVIVPEPLSDLPVLWIEVPDATALIVQRGPDEHRPFRPQAPERQAEATRSAARPGASSASR